MKSNYAPVVDRSMELPDIWVKGHFKILESVDGRPYKVGKDLYDDQLDKLSNYFLVGDTNSVKIRTARVDCEAKLFWINRGEIMSGSFIASSVLRSLVYSMIPVKDIDIYFKSKEDALEFCDKNNIGYSPRIKEAVICSTVYYGADKLNLIWGIPYDDASSLISRFDIRACSVAFDPSTNLLHIVEGAENDLMNKHIVFNPVPRAVTIRRLNKYIEKGFTIDKHQRLFFGELVRSDLYSTALELMTSEY